MIQNLMNTIENQQVKSNEPMTTWLVGVHPVAKRNKAAPSKIPKNLHLKPTNEGKKPQQNAP
jgi:hypothetical protein